MKTQGIYAKYINNISLKHCGKVFSSMCWETSAMQKLAQLSQICAASALLAGLEYMHNIREEEFHPKENFMNLKKHMIVIQR